MTREEEIWKRQDQIKTKLQALRDEQRDLDRELARIQAPAQARYQWVSLDRFVAGR